MSASLVRLIGTMPVPLFGSARTAALWANSKVRTLPRFAGWVGPLGVGALWFVWPAVDDGWKIQMGIKADPEAAVAAAKAAAEAPKKVELSAAATAKVEEAYKAHAYVETEDDKLLAKAASSGDYSELEAKWEAFAEKATRPGEDDDEEEEEDDDEEEDDEEDGDDGEDGGAEGEDDDDDDE